MNNAYRWIFLILLVLGGVVLGRMFLYEYPDELLQQRVNRLTGEIQIRCMGQFTKIDECRAMQEKERVLGKPDHLANPPSVTAEDVQANLSQQLLKNQMAVAAMEAAKQRSLRDGADEPEKCAKSASIGERKQLRCDSAMPPPELLLEEREQASRK